MENNYTIEEILLAVDDLQKIEKIKEVRLKVYTPKTDSSIIPKDTLVTNLLSNKTYIDSSFSPIFSSNSKVDSLNYDRILKKKILISIVCS